MADEIAIEVSYALPGAQRVLTLRVPAGSTARRAVVLSCIDALFPEIEAASCPLGVFGAAVADDYRLQHGDRLEVYRPLENDPMEARRLGASRRAGA
ncbi:MAG: RnfH family protein [Gammaproteobacteria bacterium]|nr:RnfH family protein [Chromatiales bacterium]MYA32020.1 RnfH family protein [Gammaproteobacteria bacterium]MYE49100.1 RnfH family protein [Gammaproteobacteria bacterium]MYF66830.1 RnfH family protein [Gammaproteobacteria bacterium]MYK36262.1 RnfH family protein [Gammaproteobacteria bacterium]